MNKRFKVSPRTHTRSVTGIQGIHAHEVRTQDAGRGESRASTGGQAFKWPPAGLTLSVIDIQKDY